MYRLYGLVMALIMCIALIWWLMHNTLPTIQFQ
jgi:hypothetical protein